jgi:hypothetical protein
MNRVTRRIGVIAAATLLATGGFVATGSPAMALPRDCTPQYSYAIESGTQNIHAFRYCVYNDGHQEPMSTSISRYVSPNVWTTVATGSGEAVYVCNGHALNIYRAVGIPQFYDTCG